MTRLVVSRRFFLRFRHHHGATFRTHHDFVFRFLELNHRHNAFVATSSEQCRFVHQVRQVSTGETRSTTGNDCRVDIGCQWYATHVNFQDLLTTANIWQANHNLTVETARTQQGWVENVRTVSRSDNDDTFVTFKTIHLNQHLVQSLFTFIVTTAQACAALAAYGVDFIDKDDARCRFLRLFEHVTNTGCTHTDEHFYEVRTGDSKERNFRFACNCFRQQRFTGTRRTYHQDAFRDLTAEFLEAARLTQILNQFSNFFFCFVAARNVSKGRFDLIFRQHARFALTKRHGTFATAALHLTHEEDPDTNQQQHREPGDEDRSQQAWFFRRFTDNLDVLGQQVIQ